MPEADVDVPPKEWLFQTEFWFDRAGDPHRIREMTLPHQLHTLRFLQLRAEPIAYRYALRLALTADEYTSEAAADTLDLLAGEAMRDPESWLMSMPLLLALRYHVAAGHNSGGGHRIYDLEANRIRDEFRELDHDRADRFCLLYDVEALALDPDGDLPVSHCRTCQTATGRA